MATRSVYDHDSAEGLISLEDARERVLSKIKPLPPIELPLTDAYGCVAAADIAAVGSSRVDLQACKLEYSIVSPK